MVQIKFTQPLYLNHKVNVNGTQDTRRVPWHTSNDTAPLYKLMKVECGDGREYGVRSVTDYIGEHSAFTAFIKTTADKNKGAIKSLDGKFIRSHPSMISSTMLSFYLDTVTLRGGKEGHAATDDSDIHADLSKCSIIFPQPPASIYLSNYKGYLVNDGEEDFRLDVAKYSEDYTVVYTLDEDSTVCDDVTLEFDEHTLPTVTTLKQANQLHGVNYDDDDQAVLLEAEEFLQAIPGLKLILTPVMNTIMSPIINVVSIFFAI
jgi:hypothetical protein